MEVVWSEWEFNIDPERLREETKNDIDAPQAIFGSKKQADEFQYESGGPLWSI